MTRRRTAAAVGALALAGGTAVALTATGGNADSGVGLTWERPPQVVRHDTIGTDRVLTAEVRNRGERTVRVRSTEVTVRDRDGRRLDSATVFLRSFTHAVYPPGIEPSEIPDSELLRSGRLIELEGGDTAPVAVAWRERRGAPRAARIDFGGDSLPIPPAGGERP